MTSKLLLIGGGGHCRSCVDVIEQLADWQIAGIVEAEADLQVDCLGYSVIGTDADLPKLLLDTPHCFITVGQVKAATVRQRLFQQLKTLNAQLPTLISPFAYVSPTAQLGEGTIVMHQALVNVQAQIGDNCIINSQALIEHDVHIGDHCHISTGAKVNGEVKIGQGCMIGSGAVIKQCVQIADGVVIGAGSLVLRDIEQAGVYTGVIK